MNLGMNHAPDAGLIIEGQCKKVYIHKKFRLRKQKWTFVRLVWFSTGGQNGVGPVGDTEQVRGRSEADSYNACQPS